MRRSKGPDVTNSGTKLRAQNRLEEIRARIDELDTSISTLLNERLTIAMELTQVKANLGMPIKDRSREEQVLAKVSRAGSNEAIRSAIKDAYERLMELSRQVQVEMPLDLEATMYFPQVTIIGLGVIGGSLARLIKRRLPETKIVGLDKTEVLAAAREEGVIDKSATDVKDSISRSALIILAASPQQNLQLLEEIAPLLSKRKLVIDVTSAKGKITQLAQKLDLKGADFIGGHPLFGSEKSGFQASQGLKIEGSTFCIVPGAKSSEISVRRLIRWLTNLNLRVEVTAAMEHDAIMARTSHLVQLVSILLGAQLCRSLNDEDLAKLARLSGPSLKQLSRLMNSAPQMWQETIAQNKEDVISALTELQTGIETTIVQLQASDTDLSDSFAQASRLPKMLETI